MEGIPLGIPAEERNISNGLKSSLHVSHDNLDKGGGTQAQPLERPAEVSADLKKRFLRSRLFPDLKPDWSTTAEMSMS